MNIYLVHSEAVHRFTTAHTSKREARRAARNRGGYMEWLESHRSLADFVRSRACYDATDCTLTLLPDRHVPDRLHTRLCRLYGPPTIPDRGEVAYWRVPDQSKGD